MVQTPHIKANSARAGFGTDDVDRLWGKGVGGLEPCWFKLLSHGDGEGQTEGDLTGKMLWKKRRKLKKKVYKSELCWILFRQVPPWLRKEKKQFARWLNETLVKSISVSRRYITLLHNYMLKRLKNESFNLLLSVKNSSSCMVPLIPFITFLRRCWGRINDFVLTVNMAALLCTPLQRGYGCSEAMNSCWSTTFYAAIKMGSGNKWTKRSLEIHSYAVTTRMEETCMTAISCLISLNF